MEAINYLTDAEGRKKAVVIDLDELKRSGQTGRDVVVYLQEELEDLFDLQLVKHEETIPWKGVERQLKDEGLLD